MQRQQLFLGGLLATGLLFGVFLLGTQAAEQPADKRESLAPLKLTGALLSKGNQFLPRLPNIEANIISPIQAGLVNVVVPIEFRSDIQITVPVNVNVTLFGSSTDRGLVQ